MPSLTELGIRLPDMAKPTIPKKTPERRQVPEIPNPMPERVPNPRREPTPAPTPSKPVTVPVPQPAFRD